MRPAILICGLGDLDHYRIIAQETRRLSDCLVMDSEPPAKVFGNMVNYFASSVGCFLTNAVSCYDDLRRAQIAFENEESFRLRSGQQPPDLEPNPLTILSRAVNALRLHFRAVFQPRWRRGRFKSKS